MKSYHLFSLSILLFSSVSTITYAQDTSSISPLAIRALQTREFTGLTQEQALKIGIATFQDLGFMITETSAPLGLIKADQTHPNDFRIIQATLTVIPAPGKENKIIARLSLSFSSFFAGEEGTNLGGQLPRESTLIQKPEIYQQFFQAYSHAIQLKSAL